LARQVNKKQSDRKSSRKSLDENALRSRAGAASSTRYRGLNASKTTFRKRRAVTFGNSPDARAGLRRSDPVIPGSQIERSFCVSGKRPSPA
jgi:hypothetical protein